jgi:hypothetical protein
MLAASACVALAGCDLSFSGITLTTCDGGALPGAACPAAASSSSGATTSTKSTTSGSSSSGDASSTSPDSSTSSGTGSSSPATTSSSSSGPISSSSGSSGSSTSSGTGSSASSSGSSSSSSGSSSSGAVDAGPCATLTVDVAYDVFDADTQGVFAIADGTPYLGVQFAAYPIYWDVEQAKTWYTINAAIASMPGTEQLFSQCLPPGSYTVQVWNIACALTDPGCPGTNNGIPPGGATYPWEIGDPSMEISLLADGGATVRTEITDTNAPDLDNFYGHTVLWSYGACPSGGGCPSGTSCYQGSCRDLGHDFQNCGDGGAACSAESCCSGACVDVATSPEDCGGCGVVCSAGTVCNNGQCQPVDAGCGVLLVELGTEFQSDPTQYQGIFAVADGGPNFLFEDDNAQYWPAEAAKTWTTFDNDIDSEPWIKHFYAACVPPGDYTVQYWQIGCVNNLTGCGTYDNGTPPAVRYLWQIGNSSRRLTVAPGATAFAGALSTTTDVPPIEAYYGTWTLWSYGGCLGGQSDCPTGTSCYQGTCYDLGYDIRNCGDGGVECTAENCCSGVCVDEDSDPNNCGGCGIVCASGTCSNLACQ